MHLFKQRLKNFVERSPYLWSAANFIIKKLYFLLPHDQEYLGLNYFFEKKNRVFFLDIGANDGLSILSFSKLFNNSITYSFEPNKALVEQLWLINKKYKKNKVFNVALSNKNRELLKLHIPKFKWIYLHTATSSNKQNSLQTIKNFYGNSIANKVTIVSFEVPSKTLDSYKLKPDVIKIDVEGHEFEVIQGSINTIKKFNPLMLIENSKKANRQIISLLSKTGYTFYYYNFKTKDFIGFGKTNSYNGNFRNFYAVPGNLISCLKKI